MNKPKILIIYTGGTIGMIEDSKTHALVPFNFDHLLQNVPKIKMLDFIIHHCEFEHPIDSSNMCPRYWKEIAKLIEHNYSEYDGFVVLHGTDTMAYTASALSFMLENLDKPVIITGSQLPIGEVRTDGEENLITALQIAAKRDKEGLPMVREVAILFNDELLRGNRSTKHSSENFRAFKSNNYPALAQIGLDISFRKDALMRLDKGKELKVHCNMDANVVFMDLFPGVSEKTVKHILDTPGLKGVVLRSYGAGNGPTALWFRDTVKEAVNKGIVVVNITQCESGCVQPDIYEAGAALKECGVATGYDMTSEAAITKLMYLIGKGISPVEIKKETEKSLRGELTRS